MQLQVTEVGILTETLNLFIAAFSDGFERLRPAIGALLRILLTLDVLFFSILVLFDIEQVKSGFRKLLALSLWVYVIQDFDQHAKSVVNSLIQAGLTAAGRGQVNVFAVMNPSGILVQAFNVTEPLVTRLTAFRMIPSPTELVFIGLTLFFVMLAYGALALNALLAVLEYYLALAVAGILMPFGILQPTRWLALKPVSFLVSSGLKLMTVAFIMEIIGDVLKGITFGEDPDLRELLVMLIAAFTIAMMSWIAPQRFAAGFMAGSASMGGSDAIPILAGSAMMAARITGGSSRTVQSLQRSRATPLHAAPRVSQSLPAGGSGTASGSAVGSAGAASPAASPPKGGAPEAKPAESTANETAKASSTSATASASPSAEAASPPRRQTSKLLSSAVSESKSRKS